MGVACNFLDIRLFDSPFLADSGGEEQEDGFLHGPKRNFHLFIFLDVSKRF